MTPMAGGISDGKEYGLVLRSSFVESFITPGEPINRVV
jgi:hypothetical protein